MPASMQNRQHAVAFIVILVLIESIGFGFVVTVKGFGPFGAADKKQRFLRDERLARDGETGG